MVSRRLRWRSLSTASSRYVAWFDRPARQPYLIFAGLEFREKNYLELWKKTPADPTDPEVQRNSGITQPLLLIHLLVPHLEPAKL